MNDDEDRAAILRRRQRLIALALTGLSGAAGCDAPRPPPSPPPAVERVEAEEPAPAEPAPEPEEPIAEIAPPAEPDPVEIRHAEEEKRRWRERNARPRVCLSIAPMVCLSQYKGRGSRES